MPRVAAAGLETTEPPGLAVAAPDCHRYPEWELWWINDGNSNLKFTFRASLVSQDSL